LNSISGALGPIACQTKSGASKPFAITTLSLRRAWVYWWCAFKVHALTMTLT